MLTLSNKFIPLMFSLVLVSGCSSSGDESITEVEVAGDAIGGNSLSGADSINDTVTNDSSTADSDGTGNTDASVDNTSGNGTAIQDGTGVMPNDTSNRVCGGISSDIPYELFGGVSESYGVYVPSLAPGVLGWDGSSYCDLTSSQGVEKISLLVPYSADAPQFDGDYDVYSGEWDGAAASSWSVNTSDMTLMRNLLFGSANGYQDGARPADWQIMHDGTYLYIGVLVRNESSSTGSQQVFLDSDDPRDDDSIDIFIDGDNSKGSSFDNVNDFHTTLAILDSTRTPEPGPNSSTGLDVEFRAGEFDDFARQHRSYEVKIKLSSAGIKIGVPFGFDIQLNEDDNGGPQDAKFAWFESTGSTVAAANPSVFGTVVLTGCSDDTNCNLMQSLNVE